MNENISKKLKRKKMLLNNLEQKIFFANEMKNAFNLEIRDKTKRNKMNARI